MLLKIYSDGSIIGSHWSRRIAPPTLPHIYAGWIIKNHLDLPIKWHSWNIGEKEGYSANDAEYLALWSALKWTSENFPLANLECYADSQIVIFQMSGKYQCNSPKLLQYKE